MCTARNVLRQTIESDEVCGQTIKRRCQQLMESNPTDRTFRSHALIADQRMIIIRIEDDGIVLDQISAHDHCRFISYSPSLSHCCVRADAVMCCRHERKTESQGASVPATEKKEPTAVTSPMQPEAERNIEAAKILMTAKNLRYEDSNIKLYHKTARPIRKWL